LAEDLFNHEQTKAHLDSHIDNNYTIAMLRNRYQRIQRGVAKGRYSYQNISIRLGGQHGYSSKIPIAIHRAACRQLPGHTSHQTEDRDDLVYFNDDSVYNRDKMVDIEEDNYITGDAYAVHETKNADDPMYTRYVNTLPFTTDYSSEDCLQDPLYLEFYNLVQPSYTHVGIDDIQV